jgi:hypothetical protein
VYKEKIMTATLHTAGHFNTMGLPAVDFTQVEQTAGAVVRTLRNVALFLAAPFIGLAYAVALPFVGMVMLVLVGGRAIARVPAAYATWIAVRNVVMFAAAPLIGLAYALALPLVGTAMLVRIAYQAYRAPVQAA